MNPAALLAIAALPIAFAAAGLLVLPAVRRTGLGVVHPAVAWISLHGVFFGIGSMILVATGEIDGASAWYVAGAALATALAVAVSDRLARRRRAATPGPADLPAPIRPRVVAILLVAAGAALAPGLLATGLPLLSGDPTGARSELAGLLVQPLRIALPAAAIVALLAAARRPTRRRVAIATAGIGLAVVFTLLLASRYLAAELAAALAVAWLLAGHRLPVRVLAALGLGALLLFGAVQVVRAPALAAGRELAFAVERTISRVLFIQPRTLDALVEVIPAETPYFGGLTWFRRLGPLVGRDDVPNLGYWIYPRIFPDQDPAIRGYAATGLIGEAWANFGAAGLALFALLGVTLERLGALLCRRRGGAADLAAGALAVVVLARTHALGLNGAAVLLALVLAWRLLAAGGLASLRDDVARVARWRA
ncbi:MAG: hypothetical protein ABIG85_05675 [Chloroflexota bacterium]